MATIDELRAAAEEIDAALSDTKDQAKAGLMVLAVAVLVAIAVSFLVGRRRGRSNRAIVEVYRD